MADVPIPHHGGVPVFYCKAEHFALEALCFQGTSVAIFQMYLGGQLWHVAGCYITPDDASTIDIVVVTASQTPQGAALIVSSDFNMDLSETKEKFLDEEILAYLATAGIEDTFTTATQVMGKRRAELNHAMQGKGDAVLFKLIYGNKLPYVPECLCTGHPPQQRPLTGPELCPRSRRYGALTLPCAPMEV